MMSKGDPIHHIWQPTLQTPGRTRNVLPAKQKRLFPIACRVVPLDLWFTTRIDRTWHIQDLKVWLLSKALPDSALTLPPSYRPSSPVTFAAPPPPIPVTHSHPSPPQSLNGSPTYGLEVSPPSPYDYMLDDDDVSLYAPSYYTVDSIEDGRVRPMTPRSIPYSFSTGAPSISGLEALKKNNHARSSNRTFPGASDAKDPELWKRAMALTAKWTIYSFSTGMQLSEDMAISEYRIRPFELLELHRTNAYVHLPRTVFPPRRPIPPPSQPPSSLSSRAFRGSRFQPPSPPSPPRAPAPAPEDTESEEDEATIISRRLGGSPYAQPYFECHACILRNPPNLDDLQRKAAKRRAARLPGDLAITDEGDPLMAPERWRKVWLTVKDGKLRIQRERKDVTVEASYEIARCVALHGPDKLEELMGHNWPRRPGTPAFSSAHKFAVCARFRQASVSKFAKSVRANKPRYHQLNQLDSTWLFFKVDDRDTQENLLRIIHRLSYSSPIAIADSMSYTTSTRPRVPRSVTRQASTSTVISAAITSSLSLLHQRTLRTDFLPNPIPHPLSLRFSAPSPRDSSPISPAFSYQFDLDDDSVTGLTEGSNSRTRRGSDDEGSGRDAMGLGLSNGTGMGVRFPEWREEVVRRGVEAGLGWGEMDFRPGEGEQVTTPIARTGLGAGPASSEGVDSEVVHPDDDGQPVYFGGYDSDEDDGAGSDTFSELEWDGWAYDLDRPKGGPSMLGGVGGLGLGLKGLQTPNASPATETDDEDDEREGVPSKSAEQTIVTRVRAKSIAAESPTFSRASSSATVMAAESTTSATSPTTMTPTAVTPSTASSSGSGSTHIRGRASTVSARSPPPHKLVEELPRPVPKVPLVGPSPLTYVDVQNKEGPSPASVSASGTGTTGRRGIMKGLTMRVGKGLENALDFVEGK